MQGTITQDKASGRWIGMVGGKVVVRTKHQAYAVQQVVANGGVLEKASVGTPAAAPAKSEFGVVERFTFIEQFVTMLVKEKINGLVLTGSGGVGKTTKVVETLEAQGLVEDTEEQSGQYFVVKGFSTPRALYRTLWEQNGKVLILDDADQVFKDPLGANILKAALDDKKTRVVSWMSESKDNDLPQRFGFTGRIIFISNLHISAFPQAILSRTQKVDVTLTTEEMVDLIEHVFGKIEADPTHKRDVLEFVKAHADQAKDLNIRSAANLIPIRAEFEKGWERLAKYSFVGV